MIRSVLILLIVLLSIIPTFASTDVIETARENCNLVESPLDVPVACEVHINCLFNSATVNCTEFTLVQLIATCIDLDIRTCVDVATLTMIAIDDAVLAYQTTDATTQLNNSLRAFLNNDFQTAIDLYENVTLSLDYFSHYNLELGLGILYLRFDNPDVALIQFDKSLNLEFYNPVAFYYRGNTYQQTGNSVRALRDHYLYDLLADTQVKALLPLRSFTIQIPNSRRWNQYPIYTMEQDNGALSLSDNTLDPLRPIVVSFVDNDETLVIADWLDIVAGDETEILFFERDPASPLRYILNINQQDVPNSVLSGKTEISVVVNPEHLDLYLKSTLGNQTLLVTSMAREVIEADARINSPARICDGASLSRLDVDVQVQILPSDRPILLWDEADTDSASTELLIQRDTEKPFTATDGFVCDGTTVWWQISNGTQSGWIPEHDRLMPSQFQLLPIELAEGWMETPPTPLQFLDIAVLSD